MKVIHHLASVDLAKRTGVFWYRTDRSANWVKVNVAISALLAYRIAHRNHPKEQLNVDQDYVDHTFESDLNSPKYSDSPFRLVYFQPTDDSDAPDNFRLECVDEYGETVVDPILNEVVGYKDGIRKAKYFIRYELRKFSKKLEELGKTNIVAPELVRVPVTQ